MKNFFDLETGSKDGKKKIMFMSLRNPALYRPLELIEDNIYYSLKNFMKENPQYEYLFYNVSFGDNPLSRDLVAVEAADVIILITVSEWTYHIPNFRHRLEVERINEEVEKVRQRLDGKSLIVVSHEQADTLDLFTDRTFKDAKLKTADIIHQEEMGAGFMFMRYHFIKDHLKHQQRFFADETEKKWDFVYFGTTKTKTIDGKVSGDVRQEILHQVWKRRKTENFSTYFIGRFDKITRDEGWTPSFKSLVPKLQQARSTLCFQWPGFEHHQTLRYPESLASGVVPLLWQNFDKNNTANALDWQRCWSSDDVVKKIKQLQENTFWQEKYDEITERYEAVLPSLKEESDRFIQVLEEKLCAAL